MSDLVAPLAEVFSSFQGEGLLVGVRQVFVRFRGCDLTCRYCDTAEARNEEGPCLIEEQPASGEFTTHENQLSVIDVRQAINALLAQAPHHSVSFTGGEPLRQAAFIAALLQEPLPDGVLTYLDTACYLPDQMALVAPRLDWVAADLKLPSTLAVPVDFKDFAACWSEIRGNRFVKIVVTEGVSVAEITEAAARLHALDSQAAVVLQPVTQIGAGPATPSVPHLFALAEAVAAHFPSVRVIPQCHRLIGVR